MKPVKRTRRLKSKSSKTSSPHRPDLLRGEDLPQAPTQNRSRAKRKALLEAGVELFARHGFEATSIDAISRHAGTAVGGFYQHFRSKRQLLLMLMNEMLQKLEQVDMQPEATDLRGTIETVLRSGLATDLSYAGAYRAWREAMLSDQRLAALDAEIRSWTTFRLRGAFAMIQQAPNARTGFDTAVFAALMDRLFWDLLGTQLASSNSALIPTIAHLIYHSLLRDP